jgi:leader peptidase (prepilin peptidase) / N-methyltransferase
VTGYLTAVAALAGLAFGSFLNVVVHRVPRKESVVRPRSRCPSCGTTLRSIDNIPVVSWLVLGGKCRTCKAPISIRYPAGEALTAILWGLAVVRLGACRGCNPFDAVAFMPFFWALVCLSLIDLEHKLIPNKILYPSLAVGIVMLAVAAAVGDGMGDFVRAAGGALASFAVFNVIHIISPGGMGYGDVRLSGLIGLHLGYLGWAHIYAGFLIGFLLGAVIGVLLMIVGKAGRKTAVPFGPFLAAGAVIVSLWGGPIVSLWNAR